MRSLLARIGCLVLFLWPNLALGQVYVTDPEVRAQIADCKELWPDGEAADNCLTSLAIEVGDPLVCNHIFNDRIHVVCHRAVRAEAGWTPEAMFHSVPLIAFIVLALYLIIARPPRSTYFSGALVGTFIACLLLYLRSYPAEWSLTFGQSYLPWLTLPVDGLMYFSPEWFTLLPFTVKFITAHALAYAAVLGIFLHGERDQYATGVVLLLFLFALSLWNMPEFAFVKGAFAEIANRITGG